MAVPFVQDWDVVQDLGEGAYGVYVSLNLFSSIFTSTYNQFIDSITSWSHLIKCLQGAFTDEQKNWRGSGREGPWHSN